MRYSAIKGLNTIHYNIVIPYYTISSQCILRVSVIVRVEPFTIMSV
uniref:Uncharacterized protein n=1 Tax=Anguilla anguilla TaxID=7936 RepID=A0A0E9XM87_ANGAN